MGDYHFVYKDVEGASTQWDDIQRKLGNLPPKPPAFKPPAFTPAPDPESLPRDRNWLEQKTEEELEYLQDDPDLDDDRFLEEYRKKRLAEMRESAIHPKFGSVNPISGSDFVREVSQAPSDVWVVVILFKEGYCSKNILQLLMSPGFIYSCVCCFGFCPFLCRIPECELLMRCIEELATRYPGTKFVKIISTDCIPNYPDRNLPTLLVYNNGAVKANHVGLRSFGRRCTPEGVAFVLCQSDPVLDDGQNKSDSSRKSVIESVRRKIIEKVVTEHEDNDDGSSSD
ncbi:hypothetical protein HS088_TW06G01117 [Tripterygium wilfordii]|uniref:Phosducin thioredoxin-like domain-containing protein n=1 Tax=Tripterygium wilfordii TaxID=458696 RepID=A0A7J7DKS9_TRIWF|nr:hypothetical protein HS088_TW06G01117 [Tripterygium wilfordii]